MAKFVGYGGRRRRLRRRAFVLAPPPSAVNYYVSSTGSDTNNGTSTSTPWQTLAKVNGSSFNPGDTINFNGGNSFSGGPLTITHSGTAGNPITFTSYGTGQATITSVNANSGVVGTNVSHVVVSNLVFTGGGAASSTTNGIWFKNTVNSTIQTDITVNNCTVSAFGADGILFSDESAGANAQITSIAISNNTVHDCTGNAAQGGVSTGSAGSGAIVCDGGNSTGFSNVTVTGNTVYNCPGLATSTDNSGNGIDLSYCSSGTNLISRNYLHDGGATANTAHPNDGIVVYYTNNCTVSMNEVARWSNAPTAAGIDLDAGCSNCFVEYNYVHEVTGKSLSIGAFFTGTWTNNVVRFNVTQNGSNGELDVAPSNPMTSSYVYNNTFFNNLGVPLISDEASSANTGNSLWFANNIFDQGGAAKWVALANCGTGFTFVNNDYFGAGATGITWVGTSYATVAAWQTATGEEKIGATSVYLTGNPAFTGPVPRTSGVGNDLGGYVPASLTNYQFASTSPCAGTGQNLATLYGLNVGTQDYWGNPPVPTGKASVGAYSFPFPITLRQRRLTYRRAA